MWTIRPDLTSTDVAQRIRATAKQPAVGCSRAPAPVIDAYEALLSLDSTISSNTGPFDPPLAPVRRAILDFNDDGAFNLPDVDAFAKAFASATANAPPDYGRADLNGDGYTGGTRVAAFNLNANLKADFSPNLELSVTVPVTPTIGTIDPFNENLLTDYNILCWYIYSPLYTGDDDRSLADATLRINRLPGCTQRASSNLVNWVYTVTVTDVNQLALNPTFFPRPPVVGETYTITQAFDPLTPDSDTRAIFGRYAGANRSFTLNFAGNPPIVLRSEDFPLSNPTNNWIAVDDDPRGTTGTYRAAMEGSTNIARTLRIQLYGNNVRTFASDALPLIPPNVSLFNNTRSAYFAVLGSIVTGRIESIVVQ